MKRFAVSLLTFALCALMIAEFSSALIVKFNSKQIQPNNEVDTLELGIKTLKNWFHRQDYFGIFQPINGTYFPRIFKKQRSSSRQQFCSNSPSKLQLSRFSSRPCNQVRTDRTRLYHPNPGNRTIGLRSGPP